MVDVSGQKVRELEKGARFISLLKNQKLKKW